jgi:hypothetical protein
LKSTTSYRRWPRSPPLLGSFGHHARGMAFDSSKPSQHQATAVVSVHALSCGHFSLPEYQFVHPVSPDARRTVPSLAFLIQHRNQSTGKHTRIVFDLGLRRDVRRYAPPIRKHVETRQPMTTDPDVTKSLASGGLKPEDILACKSKDAATCSKLFGLT